MDDARFDRLARALAGVTTRRGLPSLLATLTSLGGALALLDLEDAESKGRPKHTRGRQHDKRQRDVSADKKRKKKKHKKKNCQPQARTTTCQDTCGPVLNNCKQTVDCGPCDCEPPCGACETCSDDFVCEPCDPCCDEVCCTQANAVCHADGGACCVPDSKAQTCNNQCGDVVNTCGFSVDCGDCLCEGGCPACQVCDAETGDCVPDRSQEGDACGEEGQVCQSNGACACEAGSCPACTTCENDGFCAPCADCCDANGVCQDGETNTACGRSGTCDVCTGQEQCQDQTCVCVPDCAGNVCGPDGCGNECGSCSDGQVCTAQGQCCSPATCQGLDKTCGSWPDGCGGTLDCGTCHACFTCEDGTCVRRPDGVVCGEACCTGAGETCGGGGTPGVCGCTPTTCAALYQTMCQIPGDCDYGICGTFPDGCGSTLDCGTCGHPCFACENNICVDRPGRVVCGEACCFNSCCVTPGTGLCGAETCTNGSCCPVGWNCCNARDGSRNSTCYNLFTYCGGNGLFCCEAGNTCCTNEPCCTSNSQCTGGRRCLSGCCSFNF